MVLTSVGSAGTCFLINLSTCGGSELAVPNPKYRGKSCNAATAAIFPRPYMVVQY